MFVKKTEEKNILKSPKTFGKVFCALMRLKLNFLEFLSPVTFGVKLYSIQYKDQSNMVVVV